MSQESTEQQKLLYNEDEIGRAISRMAHEMLERNGGAGDLVLVGLRTRGAPLARRLAKRIEELESVEVPVAELDITSHRDDLPRSASPMLHMSRCQWRSRVAWSCWWTTCSSPGAPPAPRWKPLLDSGRPRKAQLAVLVDRGHRELPIRADYVGKNVPTALNESVAVRLTETDGYDAVLLRREPE